MDNLWIIQISTTHPHDIKMMHYPQQIQQARIAGHGAWNSSASSGWSFLAFLVSCGGLA